MNPDIIFKYFPDLTPVQKEQFTALGNLYSEWNAKINVISRKDIDALYERHVLHSLGIAKVMSFPAGTKILDVGTGGGFPGIPLAILFPDTHFHLIDAIGKKIKVVQEVAHALKLDNVTAEHTRAEQVKDKYDYVTSRAVTRLKPFLQWVKNKYTTGIICLKGGDLKAELKETKQKVKVYALKDHFKEDFFETKKVVVLRKNPDL